MPTTTGMTKKRAPITDRIATLQEKRNKLSDRIAKMDAAIQRLIDISEGRAAARKAKAVELTDQDRKELESFTSLSPDEQRKVLADIKHRQKVLAIAVKGSDARRTEIDDEEADTEDTETVDFDEEESDDE